MIVLSPGFCFIILNCNLESKLEGVSVHRALCRFSNNEWASRQDVWPGNCSFSRHQPSPGHGYLETFGIRVT